LPNLFYGGRRGIKSQSAGNICRLSCGLLLADPRSLRAGPSRTTTQSARGYLLIEFRTTGNKKPPFLEVIIV